MNPESIEPDDSVGSIHFNTGSSGMKEWARLTGDGTVILTSPDGTEHTATAEQAIAMYVRVAVQQGWPPFADLAKESVS